MLIDVVNKRSNEKSSSPKRFLHTQQINIQSIFKNADDFEHIN